MTTPSAATEQGRSEGSGIDEAEVPEDRSQETGRRDDFTPRRYLLLPSLILLCAALLQQPGKIEADTKAALAINPVKFLGQALHLWNASTDSGSVGNQSAGYLVPMGPFFLLTHALSIPTAVAQRFWLALLLIVGFWGAVRLADSLGLASRPGRVVGGLAYSLSPFVLSRIGDTSGIVLGGVMLPWILLPLVRATYQPEGSTRPLLSARRAAALSGVGVLLIGGINASVALDVLIAPVLWLLFMCRGRAAWILRAWWAAAVGCAIGWWLIALVVQGHYGINFVRYTETAQTTTSVTSLTETLRGTADWFGYLRVGGTGSAAAWTYIATPAAVAASLVLVGLGLAGLSRRNVPARRFLLLCLTIGVVAVAAAYGGNFKGVLAGSYRELLAGSLSPFRNINKFQPLIRLPLALGLANCLPLLDPRGRITKVGLSKVRWRRALNAATGLVVVAAVVIGAAPLGLARIYHGNDFAVPSYWRAAASWLGKSAKNTRTLLLPGTAFAQYSWGNPRDDPMLWLSQSDWAVRNLIPYGGVNSTRWLDGIEQQLDQRSAPMLAATLARGGVGYVLVRNDLAAQTSDQPASTAQVHAALAGSGLRRVASFGPLVKARASGIQLFFHSKPTDGPYPALEIYAVPGAHQVDAYPTSELAVVSGGPEVFPTLSASGVLGNRPTVLAADLAAGGASGTKLPAGVTPAAWIDTDSLTRRDESFGVVHNGGSYVLTAGGVAAGSTTAPKTRLDDPVVGHQTVAQYTGISAVSASASGFSLRQSAQLGPQAALDGDLTTAWTVSGYPHHNVGQWLQVTLKTARQVPYVTVRLVADSPKRTRITAIRLTTANGSRVTQLKDTESPQRVYVPAGSTKTLRLTIAAVGGGGVNLLGPGIRELTIPGVSIQESRALPNDVSSVFPAGGASTLSYVMARDRSDPGSFVNLDAERSIARSFVVPRQASFIANGTVVVHGNVALPKAAADGTVSLACGSGPNVQIDGKNYRTYVRGSRSALLAGQPIPMGLCVTTPIVLRAGAHAVRITASAALIEPATFVLTTQTAPAPTATRAAVTTEWNSEHRQVKVAAGAASILTVHENFNRSWTATADGKKLTAIRVDGWQQGFVLPAGGAVTVKLTNQPGIDLRLALVFAAVLVLLLLLAALLPARRAARPILGPRPRSGGFIAAASVVAAVVTALLVAGPLVAGLVLLLAAPVWFVSPLTPLLVGAGVAVAGGMMLATTAQYPGSHAGTFSTAAQIAMALALAGTILAGGLRRPAHAAASGSDEVIAPSQSDATLAPADLEGLESPSD